MTRVPPTNLPGVAFFLIGTIKSVCNGKGRTDNGKDRKVETKDPCGGFFHRHRFRDRVRDEISFSLFLEGGRRESEEKREREMSKKWYYSKS